MSTATQEQAKVEKQGPEQPKPFKMETPFFGQMVLFYPDGAKTARKPVVAHVYSASRSGQSVQLQKVGSTEVNYSVRHVDDPRLRESEDQRQEGAWDFLEEHYELKRLQAEVEELKSVGGGSEVAALRQEVAALKAAFAAFADAKKK